MLLSPQPQPLISFLSLSGFYSFLLSLFPPPPNIHLALPLLFLALCSCGHPDASGLPPAPVLGSHKAGRHHRKGLSHSLAHQSHSGYLHSISAFPALLWTLHIGLLPPPTPVLCPLIRSRAKDKTGPLLLSPNYPSLACYRVN